VYSPTKTKRNFFGGFRISKRKKERNKIHEHFLIRFSSKQHDEGIFPAFIVWSIQSSVAPCNGTCRWMENVPGRKQCALVDIH